MKWTYVIKNKLTAAILLAAVFGISLLINLLEQKRFEDLEDSFSSIYEDRLMAETYLFHLYKNLNKRERLLESVSNSTLSSETLAQIQNFREERTKYLEKYSQTYLTDSEEKMFNELLSILGRTDQLDERISQQRDNSMMREGTWLASNHQVTEKAFATLSSLSDIQTIEGTLLRAESKKIILGSISLSRLEVVLLIVIGIIIQALVFASRTTIVPKQDQPSLN